MPNKTNKAGYVIPPTKTNAMGMKMNHLSSECWRAQVSKEKRIRTQWIKEHCPNVTDRERDMATEVKKRESLYREWAHETNPHRALLYTDEPNDKGLSGRKLYLKMQREKPILPTSPNSPSTLTKPSASLLLPHMGSEEADTHGEAEGGGSGRNSGRTAATAVAQRMPLSPPRVPRKSSELIGWNGSLPELPMSHPLRTTASAVPSSVLNFGRKPVIQNGFYRSNRPFPVCD